MIPEVSYRSDNDAFAAHMGYHEKYHTWCVITNRQLVLFQTRQAALRYIQDLAAHHKAKQYIHSYNI